MDTDRDDLDRWEDEGGRSSLAEEEKPSDFKTRIERPPDPYLTIIRHQQAGDTWDRSALMAWLYWWASQFIRDFDLRIPLPPIRVDELSRRRLGHYRPGCNAWALEGEIAINSKHLCNLEDWEILSALLHECLHAWQHKWGKPGRPPYHNKEYRNFARSIGLAVDERGVTSVCSSRQPDEHGMIGIERQTPFQVILAREGVPLPALPPSTGGLRRRQPGASTLRLWQCGCRPPQRARIGRGEFFALCPLCNRAFQRVEWPA